MSDQIMPFRSTQAASGTNEPKHTPDTFKTDGREETFGEYFTRIRAENSELRTENADLRKENEQLKRGSQYLAERLDQLERPELSL